MVIVLCGLLPDRANTGVWVGQAQPRDDNSCGHLQATILHNPRPSRAYLFNAESVRIVSVACGGNHSLAIAENGMLWSCGRNRSGVCVACSEETLACLAVHVGTMPCFLRYKACHQWILSSAACVAGQLGNGTGEDSPILNRVANLASTVRIVSAGAGALHSMALASDGSLYTWGDSRCATLGRSLH